MYKVLKKSILLILCFIIVSCTKNFNNQNIDLVELKKIARIEGNHSIYIPKKEIKLIKDFSSEDCESWAVNLDLDSAYRASLRKLFEKMFVNISFSEKKLSKTEIEKKKLVSQISITHKDAISTFRIERNTAKFNIDMSAEVEIISPRRSVLNKIKSNRNWEKNIYFDCNLQEGALKSGQETLKRFIEQIYHSTYEALYKVTR